MTRASVAAAVAGILLFGLTSAAARGQSQAAAVAPPTFDVASVKPAAELSQGSGTVRVGIRDDYQRGNFECGYCTLKSLMEWTFSIKQEQIAGPDWLASDAFNIVAKMAPGTTKDRLLLMVENLLADRFHLKFHREERELQVYTLVASEKGTKLQPAEPGSPSRTRQGPGVWGSTSVSMAGLATKLTSLLDRPVLDKTGIRGSYIVSLTWAPDSVAPSAAVTDRPSLFTAIREQLGLELKKEKAQMEFLVIDHVDRNPTPN